MTSLPHLSNADARAIFLDRHALAEAPTGPASGAALAALINRIGFVQVDSINTVARAHQMILFARRQTYRPAALERLLHRDRAVWEHWTHDASILPVGLFPHWRHRFARDRERLVQRWTGWQRAGFHEKFDEVLQRISDHGPVTSADVGEGEARGSGGWWDWHPSKAALEYLWRVGELSVTRREGFRKVYDLTERVIPQALRQTDHAAEDSLAALCDGALDRLGFATSGEIAAYWAAVSPEEAKLWVETGLRHGTLAEVMVAGADGSLRKHIVRPETLAAPVPEVTPRLRILSPFDPALRDRKRAERLFGFSYRIEVFVPEPQRTYGYYVFPILEGARLVGRIDVKAFRDADVLRVRAVWPEAGVAFGRGRQQKLATELERLAQFAGCAALDWADGWWRG
ncbi:crosslink repair DNA glycosylase YcaQ family protein [Gemmobacter fulvus]|uniref:winged helix-turn-helix domain-containing protein n=1 Tax=Gemmobacter fulvus TaxID=2840474 RepID=UPI0027968FF6|nr:crosslink repair DNA glycosylase YcaQ family protein [Gemmobacter fulvus]MDQ1847056.1 crosslink repair DNA glycosylase YcaQ family protein [Gemmobacter fulvus]